MSPVKRAAAARLSVAAIMVAATILATGCALPIGGSDAPAGDTASDVDGDRAEVVRVIDGDSLELSIDGATVEVRLAGYNAPELFGLGGPSGPPTCNGAAARDALIGELGSQPLLVVGDELDRFGRRLADLVVGGASVVDRLIADGRGLATGDDRSRRDSMKAAAAGRRGLWGDGCGVPVAAGLMIGETHRDPPGRDEENLNDEWVEVVNRSRDAVDLTDWVIRDDTTGHRFRLDGRLAPDGRLRIRSGPGVSSVDDLHLGETFPVWSNHHETVLLVDPAGVVAAWAFLD